jgi:NADPH-dependent glutamate synthase beta subunit-like oxidoreductase
MKTDNMKELYPKINSLLGEIDNEVKESIKKMKKEYNSSLIEEKISLLKKICSGEELDFASLRDKYLNDKEKKLIKEQVEIKEVSNEILLSSTQINGTQYFYENKEKGNVYDNKSKIVGSVKNGIPMIN